MWLRRGQLPRLCRLCLPAFTALQEMQLSEKVVLRSLLFGVLRADWLRWSAPDWPAVTTGAVLHFEAKEVPANRQQPVYCYGCRQCTAKFFPFLSSFFSAVGADEHWWLVVMCSLFSAAAGSNAVAARQWSCHRGKRFTSTVFSFLSYPLFFSLIIVITDWGKVFGRWCADSCHFMSSVGFLSFCQKLETFHCGQTSAVCFWK